MRKRAWCILAVFSVCLCAGCNTQNSLKIDEVQTNTIVIKKDGRIQSSIVGEFDKPYYSEEGLKTFIEQEIGVYNQTAGEETITVDGMQVKDGTAAVIMTYKNLEQYAEINRVEAKVLTMEDASQDPGMPAAFTDAKSGKTVSVDEVMKNKNYKVVIVTEPLDIITSGPVKYYFNAVILSDSKVQSGKEGTAVIIYK